MGKTDLASTALFVAAVRARETRRAQPLFRDDYASDLAGPEGLALLEASESNPASNYQRDSFPYLEVRTRYFDDWLSQVVAREEVSQLVVLGAGMDTRAFRLAWPAGFRLWEVDTPELFSLKEARLESAGAKARCERKIVQADLTSRAWPRMLLKAGLSRTKPTVWLAEGLFQYLAAPDVSQILKGAAAVSPQGSHFGAEVISEDYLHEASSQGMMQQRAARGTRWRFGTNDPEKLLQKNGWKVEGKVSPLESAVAMRRWSGAASARRRPGPPAATFVSAKRLDV